MGPVSKARQRSLSISLIQAFFEDPSDTFGQYLEAPYVNSSFLPRLEDLASIACTSPGVLA